MAAPVGTIPPDEATFLNDVETFMRDRGVPFEREGKVSGRPINLYDLYKSVMARGGYDKVSGERMKWRELVDPFGVGEKHEAAMTFGLKTLYYKSLAAYEIARYWGEEPPPKEVLEDLTAKGGDLRTRTVDNYPPKVSSLDGGSDQLDEEDGPSTPGRSRYVDALSVNEASAGRQLRQDPKRTQIYQPDPTPERTRLLRNTSSPQASPAPVQPTFSQTATDPRNPSFSIDKYQPRQPIALTLRPVITPGNNRDMFYQRKAMVKAQSMPRISPDPRWLEQLNFTAASQLFQGPNIYNRCLFGLMSGIEGEQNFALHHLVKVSFERGDKFTFAGFPGLAEALLEKCLEVTEVVYNRKWQISYDQEEGTSTPHTLNACFGTPHLRETIQSSSAILEGTESMSPTTLEKLERLNEAALVVRNMITLEANAAFVSKFALFKDFLLIAINLPSHACLTEFRQYALEMAEQCTRHWPMQPDDPLYLSLVNELESKDRGRILSSLRAIFRIGVESDQNFNITNLPMTTLARLAAFVLLDDDELVEATLEVLYVFTAFPENVTSILNEDPNLLIGIVPRLTKYLLHHATAVEEKFFVRAPEQRHQIPAVIPRVPQDLYRQLCSYPEPERASRWLRCCFEESPQDEITQIAVWQAYSHQFSGIQHIAAAEFIKNISATFASAQAQVINGPQAPRFIMKGIKVRRILLDTQGNGYYKCLWEHVRHGEPQPQIIYDNNGQQRHVCGMWYSSRQNLWQHVMGDHLGFQRAMDGKFQNAIENYFQPGSISTKDTECKWINCPRIKSFGKPSEFGVHVRGHIPENPEIMAKIINELAMIPSPTTILGGRQGSQARNVTEGLFTKHSFYHTATDGSNQPAGIPFMSVMILRNLARFVGIFGHNVDGGYYSDQSEYPDENNEGLVVRDMARSHKDKKDVKTEVQKKQDLMSRIFSTAVRHELWHVLSVQRTLNLMLVNLMDLIEKGERDPKRKIEEVDGVDAVESNDKLEVGV